MAASPLHSRLSSSAKPFYSTAPLTRPAIYNTSSCRRWAHVLPLHAAVPPTAAFVTSQLCWPIRCLGSHSPPGGSGGHGHGGGSGRDGFSGDNGPEQESQPGGPGLALLLAAAAVSLLGLTMPLPAHAWGKKKVEKRKHKKQGGVLLDNQELDEFAARMAGLAGPILTNMGFSGVVGACAAAALKAVGRRLAVLVGIAFVALQALTYYGVITVNWTKVSDVARETLDATGDGRLDENDLRRWIKKGMVVMSQGLPSTSGFLLGFTAGLKLF